MALPRAHITAAKERLARIKSDDFFEWGITMCAFRSSVSRCVQVLACACFITLSAPSRADADADPWEGINRPIFSFNDTLDTYALKPLAQAYQFVTPQVAQDGIHHFFNNLGEVKNLSNNLLQAKVGMRTKTWTGYAVKPRLSRYSMGLSAPREIFIRFSLYQRMYESRV